MLASALRHGRPGKIVFPVPVVHTNNGPVLCRWDSYGIAAIVHPRSWEMSRDAIKLGFGSPKAFVSTPRYSLLHTHAVVIEGGGSPIGSSTTRVCSYIGAFSAWLQLGCSERTSVY